MLRVRDDLLGRPEPALVHVEVLVEELAARPGRPFEEVADHGRRVVDPILVPLFGVVAGERLEPVEVALDKGADDGPADLLLHPVPPARQPEPDRPALDVVRERGDGGLVEVVDPEDGRAVLVRHDPEVLGVDVAERDDGREVAVGPRDVAVVEEGRAPEEVVEVVGQLVELGLGALGPVEDAELVVLAQGAADVEPALGLGEQAGRDDDGARGHARGVLAEGVGPVALGRPGALEEDHGRGGACPAPTAPPRPAFARVHVGGPRAPCPARAVHG